VSARRLTGVGTPRVALLLAAASVAVLSGVAPSAAGTDAASRVPPTAEHDYLLTCAGCHKLDGSGSVRVPTLAGVDRLLERRGGREYLMRVPGVAQAPLSDERLAALLTWVLGRFGAAAPSPPFSAAEVGGARTEPLTDPRQARAALE
jgi:mono/diheme cytochrome c family protein